MATAKLQKGSDMNNVPASISRVCFHIDGVDFPPVKLRDCGHYAAIAFGAFPAELTIFVSWLSAKAIIDALTPFVDKPIVAPPMPAEQEEVLL